jgi:aminoglycoside/choline kinase family phosphotransferase
MNEIIIISDGYKEIFGKSDLNISALPKSGSDRKYFRIRSGDRTVIGAYNPNHEENEAFIGFTKHFISKDLPVPEIYGYIPDRNIYFLQDLGDINFYTWFHKKLNVDEIDPETEFLFNKILENLVLFQTKGFEGLNLELCYPHKSFDRQSMMWDMNYFKYMFLKLISVPFNERKLEHDFNALSDYLLSAGQEFFLYRDFQSANVMVVNGNPWFIDYQGGRKGAPQYDLASFLYDAKIPLQHDLREKLMAYYLDKFCEASGEVRETFRGYFSGFSLIRLMQALGAFGFRGLYENKPTFTDTIVPAVGLLQQVLDSNKELINLPELHNTITAISRTPVFTRLLGTYKK